MTRPSQKNYPRLRFQINKELDKKVCLDFLNFEAGGIDFGAGIMKLHSALKKTGELNIEEKESFISTYIDLFYQKSGKKLTKTLKEYKTEWSSIEDNFYINIDKIFKGYPWPKGLYVCYLSILNCNPRFLENKTFQAFYRYPSGIKHLACHEMLHFMLYDYLEKKFAQEMKNIPDDTIWTLSEAFNTIILATPDFIKLTRTKPPMYPNLIKSTKKLSLLWQKTNTVDLFLKSCLQTHL